MNRRSFLAGIIATASAPAIVRASSIMRVRVPTLEIGSLESFRYIESPGGLIVPHVPYWNAELLRKYIDGIAGHNDAMRRPYAAT